jgi:hypothetical protein
MGGPPQIVPKKHMDESITSVVFLERATQEQLPRCATAIVFFDMDGY